MKFTKEMQDRIIAWVEVNGLHPQACGASIKQFCEAMGISFKTYQRWQENDNFVNALNHAREKFKSTTICDVENALVKAAKGVDFTKIKEEAKAEVIKEYDPKTGKKVREYTGELKTIKATRETYYYPPDVNAAKFVLTNMAPDRWKLKQEITHQGGEQPIELNFTDPKALEGLQRALATGAQPRKPKDEE